MKNFNIRRGDILQVRLPDPQGHSSVHTGTRPCLVIGNNAQNKFSPTILVAPITTKSKKPLPTHVSVKAGSVNLRSDSTILLEQVITVDKSRIEHYIGCWTEEIKKEVEKCLAISLGMTA
jgi:mRNA interferase MazF